MGIIKSLIGSLIGAAVAMAIYYGIKQTTGETYIWFPIVIGILTGIAARVFAGSSVSNAGRLASGALAGIIAGVAIFSPEFVEGLWANQEFGPVKLENRLAMADADKDSDSDSDNATDSDSDQSSDEDADDDDSAGNADESDQADSELDDEGAEDSDTDQAADNGDKDDENDKPVKTVTPNDVFKDRGKMAESVQNTTDNSEINSERFAELIKKRKHVTWYDFWMPYVFSGIGVLIAYQLARGFGSSPAKT